MTGQGSASGQMASDWASPEERQMWLEFTSTQSPTVRDQLFEQYKGFAVNAARRRHSRQSSGEIEIQDLCQLAFAGLLEAIDRFNPNLGSPFRPFAIRRIDGSILDGISKMSEVREQVAFRKRISQERVRSLRSEQVESLSLHDAMSSLAEIAVGLAIGLMLEGTDLFRSSETAEPATAYESAAWREMVERMREEIETLPPRERLIIVRHYLDGMNFDQIGKLLDVSKGRVSQLHRSSLNKLKTALTNRGVNLGP